MPRFPDRAPRAAQPGARGRRRTTKAHQSSQPSSAAAISHSQKLAPAPDQRRSPITTIRQVSGRMPSPVAQMKVHQEIAVSPAAWKTAAMEKYVAAFPPAAVARDQLEYAVPELSTHDNQRVTQALNDELQAALTGRKGAQAALDAAQVNSTRLLRPFSH